MIADYYNQSVIIQRKTSVPNGIGGYVENWANHITLNGLIDQISGNEKNIAAQFADSATHILISEAGYEIKSTDRAVCEGEIYRILNPDNPMGMNHHLEILLVYEGVDQ
ncbi:head-tail adaptor protein [Paenibacillus sp. sgz302251]|uniref:head-tail adaptor protein n=1 Tax=Paenibacillus sp. sgz302251 TaxID=3414493 RepID=UPI003C7B9062